MPESTSNQPSGGDGSYVVVARRYRPLGFDELVGQEHVGRALKNAIESNRVGHAYLFTGARGVGKTSTARIFAKALNDPGGPTVSPDNTSDVARAIDAGEDVDVIEIDGASNRGIDEIRSLRANIGVRPSRSRFKIYIIDEVHMLTAPAFNALLKTLEEPPEHVKFIFCTTDPEKLPITVLSRCQRFDFAPVEISKIVARLTEIVHAESVQAEEAALELIARRAAGSMRDSQSLLEQVLSFSDGKLTADVVHATLGTADDERLHQLAKAMVERDAAAALRQMDEAIDAGIDAGRLAEQLLGYFRDLMAVTVGCDASLQRYTSASLHEDLKKLGDAWGLQTVLAVIGLIDQVLARIRYSVHGRVLLEATLIQICSLPDLQRVADLAAAAATVGAESSSSASEKKKAISDALAARGDPPHAARPPSARPASSAVAATPDADSRRSSSESSPSTESTVMPGVSTPNAASSAGRQEGGDVSSQPDRGESAVAVMTAPAPPDTAPLGTAPPDTAPRGTAPASAVQPQRRLSWDQANAERIWKDVLGELESMTETFARVVKRVEAVGTHQLRLVFPADASLAKKRCQLPEHQTALTDAVSRLAGQTIVLEFASAAPAAVEKKPAPTSNKPTRLQRMREIESNQLVQSCVELFDAEIVRIDKPK